MVKNLSFEGNLRKFVGTGTAKKELAKILNWRKMVTEGNLEHQEWRNNSRNRKYLGKYGNRLLGSEDLWSKLDDYKQIL